jgi:glucose/arabinose dehydrogenase/mono/diheme cytochrome c family protein
MFVSMRMLFKITGSLLLMSLFALAQQGDDKGVKMDPVVPEKLIPPSPVLTVDQALKTFDLAPGFVIEPVAAEPLVDTPVCLDFDAAGRMWVCEMRGYMPDIDGKKESDPQGRIVILEDTNADGKVDKRTVFLEKQLLPRAISVFQDGVLFIDEKRICWIKRNGDTPVGEPQVIDTKLLQGGNVEHKPNGLLANLDNRYYLAKSDRRLKRVGDTWEIEPSTFRGQWGIARDDYGRLYHNNNSTLLFGDLLAPDLLLGNPEVKMKTKDYTQLGSNRVWPIRVTPAVNRAYISKAHGFDGDTLDPKTYKLINATAASGMTIYRGTNFPAEWNGTAFATEPVCNLVKAIRITEKNGEMRGEHPLDEKEFLASTDERFRPVNAYTAPDGSLYVVDMYHGIIQHNTYMTSYLRKQTLDRGLESPPYGCGRIYRIRSKAGKIQPVTDLTALHGLDLVRVLTHPNAWQRETAQRLLVERKEAATIPFLEKLAKAGTPVQRIHAFWTLEGMGALKADSLLSSIQTKDAKLQSSALWASTRLEASELAKLTPALVGMSPAEDEVMPYLARALGPIGTPAAFTRLSELITKNSKVPFVRESAVSGLDQRELAFKDACLKESKDTILVGWLDQGARDAKSKALANHLTGDALVSFERGKKLFLGEAACFGCHGADGDGMPNLGPPLDSSEWVTGNPKTLLNILLHGLTGPITVDGESYKPEADMPALGANPTISDQDLADISTYIRNEWSNKSAPVTLPQAQYQREATKTRGARPWTATELSK